LSNRRTEPLVIDGLRGSRRLECSRNSIALSAAVCELLQPSFKLIGKQRDGARVRKSYSAPTTSHQRLAADPRTSDAVRTRLHEICISLDQVESLRDIRSAQQRLADLADLKSGGDSIAAAPPIDLFLASLRTTWKEGASRPTYRPILKAKRGRRRPDPLILATPQLQEWFKAEPGRTGAELLTRLKAEYPGAYQG
jgi:hypothetical protein